MTLLPARRPSALFWLGLAVAATPALAQEDALVDDAAPDEVAPTPAPAPSAQGAPEGEHAVPDRYRVDAAQPPDEVVRELIAAAEAGDEEAYRARLSERFIEGVELLQAHPGEEGAEAWRWEVFLAATSAEEVAEAEVVQFYERATVRAETADGRVLKFRLVVEDGAWKVDLPEPLADLVERRRPAPEPGEVPETAAGEPGPTGSGEQPAAGQGGGHEDALDRATGSPVVAEPSGPAADPDLSPGPVVPPAPTRAEPLEPGFFEPGGPGHYVWYIPDYLFLASSAVVFGFGLTNDIAPPWILIGPDHDLEEPKPAGLLDPRLDEVLGRPMVQEKVPPAALAIAGGAGILGLGALDTVRHLEFHHTHAFVVGAATSAMLTLSATEALKIGVGRLRPDFRERYSRAACGGYVEAPSRFDCSAVPDDGFVVDKSDVIYGMRSFPSGHASVAFSFATYFSLYLGGEYVWGKDTPAWAMPLAVVAMASMLTGAGFVAASRFSDNRHHLEDVVVGAGLGSTIAAGTYFLHFDTDGDARWRDLRFSATPVEGRGAALSLSGTF